MNDKITNDILDKNPDHREEWRFIPSYGTLYSVSSEGRIRSNRNGVILAIISGKPGACAVVRLFKDKSRREYSIAKLVWTAFNGDIPDGHVVLKTVEGDYALRTLELCLRGHLYRKGNRRASQRKAKVGKDRKDIRRCFPSQSCGR